MQRHLWSIFFVVMLLLVGGCSRPREAAVPPGAPTPSTAAPGAAVPASESITLTVWDWHAADPSKGVGLWLTNIDREYEKAHPGVKIKHVGQSHTEYYEILKAAFAAASPDKGPDVVMLHQGNRIMDQRPSLRPLTEYVTPDFKRKIVGWDLTSDNFDPNGTPWAVSIAVQGLVWYYNKAVLQEAGLDPAKPPRTWSEFLDACDKVKAVGKAGIAVGEKEGFWADWFVNSAYFQTITSSDKERLLRGDMKFTDPKFTIILERLKELGDRGCFQKGAMSTPLFPDAGEEFMRGKAAFFLGLISDVAHWKEFGEMIGAENLGVMTCPVFQPGPDADKFPTGGAFAYAITRTCQHPQEAFDYIAFVASDEHAATFLSEVGSFPANQTYDRGLIKDPCARQIADWMAAGKTGPHLGDRLPTEVGEAIRRECQRLLSGQTDVTGAAQAIQKAADAARASRSR